MDAEAFKQTWKQFTTTEGKQHAKEDVLDTYFAESGKTIDWLYETGWIFGDMGKENRFTGGLTSYNVALTSNVDTGTYEDRRKILNSYYQQMVAEVAAQGGEYLLETEGYAFLTEGDKVVGVKARNRLTGKEYTIHAKAVIMNTGGFSANPDMVDALLDERWRGERKRIGTDQDTGLMIQAALDIGAGTYNIGMSPNVMHVSIDHWLHQFPINFYDDVLDGRTGRYKVWTLNNIPLACGISANTVAVNKEGKRYMNEAKYESFSDDPSTSRGPASLRATTTTRSFPTTSSRASRTKGSTTSTSGKVTARRATFRPTCPFPKCTKALATPLTKAWPGKAKRFPNSRNR